MTETLQKHSPEHRETGAEHATAERPKAAEYGQAERAAEVSKAEAAVAAVEASTEQPALPADEPTERPAVLDNALKMFKLKQNLGQVQKRLKPGEKAFSKVVHQRAVRVVSESAAKTVSRPSGLLGGGIMAFAGSLLYVFLTHRLGFSYNYLLFIVFFGGGFLVGVAFEFAAHLRRPKAA